MSELLAAYYPKAVAAVLAVLLLVLAGVLFAARLVGAGIVALAIAIGVFIAIASVARASDGSSQEDA